MNCLNLAIRAAALYLTGRDGKDCDVTQIGAVDLQLFADCLTAGIDDYWSLAPTWITSPRELTPLSTVANQNYLALPMNFARLSRPPRISEGNGCWRELIETAEPISNWSTPASGPQYFRIEDALTDTPVWDETGNDGNTVRQPRIILYPTPGSVLSLDVQSEYVSPRITVEHLSGRANTVDLPIPDKHLTGAVVPLCAPHFASHPLRKPKDDYPDIALQVQNGTRFINNQPQQRTATMRKVGRPYGY